MDTKQCQQYTRLTRRNANRPRIVYTICENCVLHNDHCAGWTCAAMLAERLAQYEDTGYSPAQITELSSTSHKSIVSKECFCNVLQLILKQRDINKQFSEALKTVVDGRFVFGTPNYYLDAALLVLKEAVGDKYEYIDWWLFELGDKTIALADGSQSWDLTTPEALYDYIVEVNGK